MRSLNSTIELETGHAYPLGAHWDGSGVNFALLAPHASQVWLCLFDASGEHETMRLALPGQQHGVWFGYLAQAAPDLLYGYRVAGRWAPESGQWFNPNKVLLDPYAREVVGHYTGQIEHNGYAADNPQQPCPLDNAASALKGRVIDPHYDWAADKPPRIAPEHTVLYECHVKGFTQRWRSLAASVTSTTSADASPFDAACAPGFDPGFDPALCGTYAALTQPSVLDYLQQLGITSVSLLPVHAHADEARLCRLGLANYWGYNSIGFFAPEPSYWSGRAGTSPTSELRDAVKALHARGLEVILDVVYNHSAEGDETGPTLSFRGIDNALYYQLHSETEADGSPTRHYQNHTGCGNTLNLNQPEVLQWVLDSLRYWVSEFHIDGFRFDLAPVLGRTQHGFERGAPLLAAIMQDPLLCQVKLIAEPWDIGPHGYQLGQFPTGWMEWNDQFRDTLRAFWLHQWPTLGEFARRFAASSDIFQQRQRLPTASVNFICAHDGFTLADLVSYNHKHNLANGENNRDGHGHNHSWNGGVEGPSSDPDIVQLRARLQRALLASLLFSQGTPMLLAGDEIGHSQGGNNNAYCQDNATTWLNWADINQGLHAYVTRLLALRRRYPALRCPHWFRASTPDGPNQVDWYHPNGTPMRAVDWEGKTSYCIAIYLHDLPGGEDCLLLCNAEAQAVKFTLPQGEWQVQLDSAQEHLSQRPDTRCASSLVAARSLMLMTLTQIK